MGDVPHGEGIGFDGGVFKKKHRMGQAFPPCAPSLWETLTYFTDLQMIK